MLRLRIGQLQTTAPHSLARPPWLKPTAQTKEYGGMAAFAFPDGCLAGPYLVPDRLRGRLISLSMSAGSRLFGLFGLAQSSLHLLLPPRSSCLLHSRIHGIPKLLRCDASLLLVLTWAFCAVQIQLSGTRLPSSPEAITQNPSPSLRATGLLA